MPSHPIVDTLNTYFSGKILSGRHDADIGSACILEVVAKAKGLNHTDSPEKTGMPDIRSINDAYRGDTRRSLAMVRLGVALWDWSEWSEARKVKFTQTVALQFIREILPMLLEEIGLPDHAKSCREANDLDAAYAAAYAAYAAAYAAYAAYAAAANAAAYAAANAARVSANAAANTADAAYAAYAAANAAAYAADAILDKIVDLWIKAAQENK